MPILRISTGSFAFILLIAFTSHSACACVFGTGFLQNGHVHVSFIFFSLRRIIFIFAWTQPLQISLLQHEYIAAFFNRVPAGINRSGSLRDDCFQVAWTKSRHVFLRPVSCKHPHAVACDPPDIQRSNIKQTYKRSTCSLWHCPLLPCRMKHSTSSCRRPLCLCLRLRSSW